MLGCSEFLLGGLWVVAYKLKSKEAIIKSLYCKYGLSNKFMGCFRPFYHQPDQQTTSDFFEE